MPSSRIPQRPYRPDEATDAHDPGGAAGGPAPQPASHTPPPPPTLRPNLADVLATLACFLGAGFIVAWLAGAVGVGEAGAVAWLTPLILAAQSFVFLLAFLVVVWQGRGLSLRALGLGPRRPGWLKTGALWGLGVIPGAMAVNVVTFVLLGADDPNPQVEMLAPEGPTLIGFLLILPLAAVFVPFVEELAFRGVLYGWLRLRLPAGWAMVASAAVFSIAHGIPQLIPALALVGYFLARLREREDSLWPAIAMHGVFNGVMTVILFAAMAAAENVPAAA